MRLLIINSEYPPVGAGAGNASANIARLLAQAGHEVVVVTTGYRDLAREEIVHGIRVLRGPTRRNRLDRSTALEQVAFMLGATIRCLGLARQARPQAILAFFGLPSGAVAWFLKMALGIPYVVSLRGGDVPGFRPYDFWLYHRVAVPLLRLVWNGAAALVANSEGLRTLANEFDERARIQIIPNGVDTTRFTPGDRSWNSPTVLSVGRVVHQKGLDLGLAALAGLKELAWEWRIAGDGPQADYLKRSVSRESMESRVRFLGWIDADQLVKQYQEASIFMFPSRHEGMPNALLEAMASGLPVVASEVAGNEELVIGGHTGLLVPTDDSDALREALRALLTDADLRARMGRAGRARAAREYTWARAAEAYETLIRKAVG
jgi:glycosyltransferase involved in cell wall biosynthesis